MINKNRVEAFSDGVLAIVATILVLELVVPNGVEFADFAAQWPVFLAFFISFFQIYITWYNHNKLFSKIKCVGKHVFLLNGLWLFFACLVPFTIRYFGEHPDATIPMIVYLVNLLLWEVSFHILDIVVLHENPGVQKDETTDIVMRVVYYIAVFCAIVIAWFMPRISLFVILIVVITSIIAKFLKASKHHDQACK